MVTKLLNQLAINAIKGHTEAEYGILSISVTPANGYHLKLNYKDSSWVCYTHSCRVSESRLRYDYKKLLRAAIGSKESQVRKVA